MKAGGIKVFGNIFMSGPVAEFALNKKNIVALLWCQMWNNICECVCLCVCVCVYIYIYIYIFFFFF